MTIDTNLPTDVAAFEEMLDDLRYSRDKLSDAPGDGRYRGFDTLIRIFRNAGPGGTSRWKDESDVIFHSEQRDELTMREMATAYCAIGEQMDAAGEDDPERWERYRRLVPQSSSDVEVTRILSWEKTHGWHNGQAPALRPPRGKDIGYERWLDSIYEQRDRGT